MAQEQHFYPSLANGGHTVKGRHIYDVGKVDKV